MKVVFTVLFLLSLNIFCVKCAKVLAIFPSPGYSQFILGDALIQELVNRKHNVTLISAYKPKLPDASYKHISTADLVNQLQSDLFHQAEQGMIGEITSVSQLGLFLTEFTLSNCAVQELIKSDNHFDLILLEQFFDEALMGFANHFKAPLVLLSSMGSTEWTNHLAANPEPYSYIPLSVADYASRMTFFQRLKNTFVGLFDVIYRHCVTYPRQNEILQKYFPNAPNLYDIIYNASIILLNSDPSVTDPVPHVSNMVEIGGFHIKPKTLSNDLQEFLDSANEGGIFFSMGSNLHSANFPAQKLQAFFKIFSEIPQKVLWKFETDLPNKPKNVKIQKWMPQADILGHPNIVAFITHGGLLSNLESIYHGVPMITIPIFGDQNRNAATAFEKGYSLTVRFEELNEDKLRWALSEMINNTRFREAAKRRSRIMHDRPIKPLDSAVYWIEYVIRHRGAPHLRSQALDLAWYQYLLLDVICSCILTILILLFSIRFIAGTCARSASVKHKQKRN